MGERSRQKGQQVRKSWGWSVPGYSRTQKAPSAFLTARREATEGFRHQGTRSFQAPPLTSQGCGRVTSKDSELQRNYASDTVRMASAAPLVHTQSWELPLQTSLLGDGQ